MMNVIHKNLKVCSHTNINKRYGRINTILIIRFSRVPHSRKIKKKFFIIIDEISSIIAKIYYCIVKLAI